MAKKIATKAPVAVKFAMIATKFGFKLKADGSPGFEGLDSRPAHIKEVAEAIGKSPRTVDKQWAATRVWLRKYLAEHA